MSLRTVLASDLDPIRTNAWLVGCVAPRPIAFASTVNEAGGRNLAPFAFSNTKLNSLIRLGRFLGGTGKVTRIHMGKF